MFTLSEIIETKIETYNTVRNICIDAVNNSKNEIEKESLNKIVKSIDNLMKSDGVEHYVFRVTL